jgi:hypothetical protein
MGLDSVNKNTKVLEKLNKLVGDKDTLDEYKKLKDP